jgi:FKBP-type peptidyl-prolyl cis-trans isomerase
LPDGRFYKKTTERKQKEAKNNRQHNKQQNKKEAECLGVNNEPKTTAYEQSGSGKGPKRIAYGFSPLAGL